MTFPTSNLFLPLVLTIHNVEEYVHYEDFARNFHGKLPSKMTTRRVVRDALILLTLSVGTVSVLTYRYRSSALVKTSQVATFALTLNGVGHCMLSIKQGTLLPGAASALAVVLPY